MASLPSTTSDTTQIPVLSTLEACRAWRSRAFAEHRSVGYVATMGALHDGHLALVKRSLAENDLTIVSIFVNPGQFAPHEDFASYPRTLPADLALLAAQSVLAPGAAAARAPAAAFVPSVQTMYPSGITQDPAGQRGAFVEVLGLAHQMEGRTRPLFFRGVATIVIKLFNAVQPTRTYFGQKDIQQALLLRRMCADLLLPHPAPHNLIIVPTVRDPSSGLARSSRNAYLTRAERAAAGALYAALGTARAAWEAGGTARAALGAARARVEAAQGAAPPEVVLALDYVEMCDAEAFEGVPAEATAGTRPEGEAILLCAAMWVGKTRLIDNVILGNQERVFG